jgi:hypothetical protein
MTNEQYEIFWSDILEIQVIDSGYDCHTGMEIAELTKYAIREGLTSL